MTGVARRPTESVVESYLLGERVGRMAIAQANPFTQQVCRAERGSASRFDPAGARCLVLPGGGSGP